MATISKIPQLNYIFFILMLSLSLCLAATQGNRELYIVYMGSLPGGTYSPESHHIDILQNVVTDHSSPTLYRSYYRSFNGFAAWLSEEEQEKLYNMEEVLSIFPSRTLQLQTTRSWDFIGFPENNVTRYPTIESDTIIGVLDSGIWPDSESFSDVGFGPVPKKWKGVCNGGSNFTCNRKIIGARFYIDSTNAVDEVGHGTHTSSTAAGNVVKGAGFYDIAEGTARGGVPSSRIAVYKICSDSGCESANILSGFDDAIADGVDVITISVGGSDSISLAEDAIAVGSFHAMVNNIVTVNSAGNNGAQGASTIVNLAPWMISVGASSIDRKIIDKVVLGDGRTVIGASINTFSIGVEPEYPLLYGKVFNSSCFDEEIKSCSPFCLDKDSVKGKIVMCNAFASEYITNELEVAGVITLNDLPKDVTATTLSPGVELEQPEFDLAATYAASTEPRATILTSETVKDPFAPVVAAFSSRGPNSLLPEIMKPDVVAPGVNILAAYPPYISPTKHDVDKRSAKYNILSGTSMACPHVAGAIAYLKTLHPDWSPSALKSAIMTTARPLNASMHPDREFAYGAGNIDPLKAVNPGLVYDISKQDYTALLCSAYDNSTCSKITGEDCHCLNKAPLTDFNYPALTAMINGTKVNVNFTRVVTNVGDPKSTYKAEVIADPNLKITVVPDALSYNGLSEKNAFQVSITGSFPENEKILSSQLVWSDGSRSVRSPIVVYTTDF